MLVTLGLVAAFLLASVTAVFYLQQFGTFPAPPAGAQRAQALAAAHGEALWLEVDGGRVETWLLPGAARGPAPLLIYTHGNGELIDFWADEFAPLRNAGLHVLLVEYPGYGRSRGRPSERNITATLVAAYDLVARDPRVDAARIVGYGRSLGGGAIAQLAARRPLATMVLESTFTSLADIVRGFGVPDWLIVNRFDTRSVLERYPRPVLLIHGTLDVNIPVSHAHGLKSVLTQGSLRLLHCGHNDCPRQWEPLLSFLVEIGVCRRPDQETSHETHRC